MKILREGILIQEDFLDRSVLPDEIRLHLRRAHGEFCYRLGATAFYHHQWRLTEEAIQRGWRRNILWPLIFTEMALRRIKKEITGHE